MRNATAHQPVASLSQISNSEVWSHRADPESSSHVNTIVLNSWSWQTECPSPEQLIL